MRCGGSCAHSGSRAGGVSLMDHSPFRWPPGTPSVEHLVREAWGSGSATVRTTGAACPAQGRSQAQAIRALRPPPVPASAPASEGVARTQSVPAIVPLRARPGRARRWGDAQAGKRPAGGVASWRRCELRGARVPHQEGPGAVAMCEGVGFEAAFKLVHIGTPPKWTPPGPQPSLHKLRPHLRGTWGAPRRRGSTSGQRDGTMLKSTFFDNFFFPIR